MGQPSVSKQVAALERRVGAQLLNRTSRGLRPTPAGAEFYHAAVRILADLDDAESQVASGHDGSKGTVRIGVPPLFTSLILMPHLAAFLQRFPDITTDFVASERYADLMQEGLDLAVLVGDLDNSGLVARRIGSMQLVTVASPAYLARHGEPATPDDLARHELLANRQLGAISVWRFRGGSDDVVTPASGRFSCNNPADMRAAAIAGLGIVQSARAIFAAQLRSGQVKELLIDFIADPLPIHAIYNSSRVPRRVRIVSDFIADCLDANFSLRLPGRHSISE